MGLKNLNHIGTKKRLEKEITGQQRMKKKRREGLEKEFELGLEGEWRAVPLH